MEIDKDDGEEELECSPPEFYTKDVLEYNFNFENSVFYLAKTSEGCYLSAEYREEDFVHVVNEKISDVVFDLVGILLKKIKIQDQEDRDKTEDFIKIIESLNSDIIEFKKKKPIQDEVKIINVKTAKKSMFAAGMAFQRMRQ